jgi:hypothetical protein
MIEHYERSAPQMDLQRAVEGCLQGRYRSALLDGQFGLRLDDDRDQHRISAHWRYEPLWSVQIPAKVTRKGSAATLSWVHAVVQGWLAGAGGERDQALEAAEVADRQARESRAAAAATEVSEPAELTAALAELDRINRLIAQEITDSGKSVGAGDAAA